MRSKALFISVLGFSLPALCGQAPATPPSLPLQAEFIKPVQVQKLAPGATIFAKVTAEWAGSGCALHPGAMLEGKVEAYPQHKNGGSPTLALSFDRAQCNGNDMQPFPLILVAAAAPPSDFASVPNVEINVPQLRPHRVGGDLVGPGNEDMFTVQGTTVQFTGASHHFPLKADLKPGDVIGIKGVKLDVATGPHNSSVFTSAHGDVALKAFTQILLNPPSVALVPAPRPAAAAANLPRADRPAALAQKPMSTLELCKAPSCLTEHVLKPFDLDSRSPITIAAETLGYIPRSRRLLADLEHDTALAWLGSDQLLFAFNLHPLIERGSEAPEATRMVHAVLLNAVSHAVLHSVDWRIHDAKQFLWQLDAGRVLVHVDDELRVYGAGLQLQQTIPLGGALEFLRPSPGGESILMGTVRERHSPALHMQLRKDTGAEPEEDIAITVFDKDLHIVTSATSANRVTPPTLLNEGQVSLQRQPDGDWRMAVKRWENTSATLAHFSSLCAPQVSSISPDLLFLVSCVSNVGDPEYRVLRPDGTLMLRGPVASRQMGLEASGNSQRFAVKAVSRAGDGLPGQPFAPTDLESAEIRVFRAADGKRLAALRISDPPASYGGFALSPDGSQLAVLSGSEIKLFAIPND